jgi:hypothetical protein
LATATKNTKSVPVTNYEEKVTGITLELTLEEAQELRNVISDIHIGYGFDNVTAVKKALNLAGIHYQGRGVVSGRLTKVAPFEIV